MLSPVNGQPVYSTTRPNPFYGRITTSVSDADSKYYAIVAHPDVKATPVNYPTEGEKAMAKMDVDWMAKNRERILAEWSKRYDGKSAPKAK